VTIRKRQRSGVLDWFEADIPAYSGTRGSFDMVGLLDWELWSQACHVAFACRALVTVYGQDVTGWGRELHGQVRGGDDCAKCIEGRTT